MRLHFIEGVGFVLKQAPVAESVDARASKARAFGRVRSTRTRGTYPDEGVAPLWLWQVALGVLVAFLAYAVWCAWQTPVAEAQSVAKRGTVAYCKQRAEGRAERACIIRVVFAPYGMSRKALRVAWCESSFRPWATNGIYKGMFQVSPAWRREVRGFGPRAEQQARHALRVVLHPQGGWSHWECQ